MKFQRVKFQVKFQRQSPSEVQKPNQVKSLELSEVLASSSPNQKASASFTQRKFKLPKQELKVLTPNQDFFQTNL